MSLTNDKDNRQLAFNRNIASSNWSQIVTGSKLSNIQQCQQYMGRNKENKPFINDKIRKTAQNNGFNQKFCNFAAEFIKRRNKLLAIKIQKKHYPDGIFQHKQSPLSRQQV